jgi:hypothetical protein
MDLFVGPIDMAARKALKAGGRTAFFDTGGLSIAFDLKSPKVVAFLKDRAAERVSMVTDTTKGIVRTMIVAGREENHSWSDIARDLKDRFEEFAAGKPQMHVDSRAHLIAMTEVGDAYTEGNLQAAQQLAAAGLEQEKSWETIGDDRVSDGCLTNEGAGWIPLDDDFPSGHQRPLRFPGCRCDLLTRRKR